MQVSLSAFNAGLTKNSSFKGLNPTFGTTKTGDGPHPDSPLHISGAGEASDSLHITRTSPVQPLLIGSDQSTLHTGINTDTALQFTALPPTDTPSGIERRRKSAPVEGSLEWYQAEHAKLMAKLISHHPMEDSLRHTTAEKALEYHHKIVELAEQRATERGALDKLTGLPQREAFEKYLDRQLALAKQPPVLGEPASAKNVTVLFFDIDRFKNVNDTYGYKAGDKALVLITKLLSHSVRPEDMVARWGGEEISVGFETGMSRKNVETVTQRMLNTLVGLTWEVMNRSSLQSDIADLKLKPKAIQAARERTKLWAPNVTDKIAEKAILARLTDDELKPLLRLLVERDLTTSIGVFNMPPGDFSRDQILTITHIGEAIAKKDDKMGRARNRAYIAAPDGKTHELFVTGPVAIVPKPFIARLSTWWHTRRSIWHLWGNPE